MRLEPLTREAALAVVLRMRRRDRREIYATCWHDNPVEVAEFLALSGKFGWAAFIENDPVAIVGARPLWPGVWSVWMVATDRFREIRFSMTRFIKHGMIPALVQTGAHRAETTSLAIHHEAHRWLEALGATREATFRAYGRNGEDFVSYVWTLDGREKRQER